MKRIPSYALFSADRGKTFAGDNFGTVIKKNAAPPLGEAETPRNTSKWEPLSEGLLDVGLGADGRDLRDRALAELH